MHNLVLTSFSPSYVGKQLHIKQKDTARQMDRHITPTYHRIISVQCR